MSLSREIVSYRDGEQYPNVLSYSTQQMGGFENLERWGWLVCEGFKIFLTFLLRFFVKKKMKAKKNYEMIEKWCESTLDVLAGCSFLSSNSKPNLS